MCFGYAWDDDLTIYGSEDKLEDLRDFRRVDLDEMLRRKEDKATWIFPEFARDAFERRLLHANYLSDRGASDGLEPPVEKGSPDVVERVFGATQTPRESVREYAGKVSMERVLKLDESWPDNWRSHLSRLFSEDPFEATLAAAWARQRGRGGQRGRRLEELPPTDNPPWENSVWRADRTRECVTQVAARCAQRIKWSGKDDILALSSGNISIFLSICHEVWDAFLRSERKKPKSSRRHPLRDGIPPSVQAVGIRTASRHWYEKISERPKGHDRQRFADVLGRLFRKWLVDDDPMSYPGHTGFSLSKDDLEAEPLIRGFLNEAVDYGDLYDAPHTTKEADRRPRTKWYLAPILSVMYQIPEAHKKEPYYATIAEVKTWLREAGIVIAGLDLEGSRATGKTAANRVAGEKEDDRQKKLAFDDDSAVE